MHIRSEGRAHGKTERMARELQARIRNGERIIVRTPAGSIAAEQWLANRGYANHPDEYPATRIARGDA